MNQEYTFKIILQKPPANVDYGLQKGRGNNYEIIQKQRSSDIDLIFGFKAIVRNGKDSLPDFYGPMVQGPAGERFVYIGIGTYAGDPDSTWSRRLKIPLRDISQEMISKLIADPSMILETKVPGTGKDGTPTCATVKPFAGWHLSGH
jgi:hypothetical protein